MSIDCDIFISFKNLDEDGNFTEDSLLAKVVYDFLTAKGLDVFFSKESLERLGIAAYQKAIDNALDAAKIVITVGTSRDNLESKWVRYEWSSFYNDILSERKPDGKLFSYVKNIEIHDLPRILRQNEVINHQEGSLKCLCNFISNALGINPLNFRKIVMPPKGHVGVLEICEKCNEQFDPKFPSVCSYHPETPINLAHLGPRDDYREVWKFPCCGLIYLGAEDKEGYDIHPKQTPGCVVGEHKITKKGYRM